MSKATTDETAAPTRIRPSSVLVNALSRRTAGAVRADRIG